jgi:tetratricopeptide (TPR) repeat protein
VIGKFIDGSPDSDARAEHAFRRALELNPRLTAAHMYYAHLEAEMGQSQAALVRLLREADRHGNDPELFAGLVHACRYCGLFDQSIAAHGEARRLDPNVPTSLEQTILMTSDIERLLAVEAPPLIAGVDDGIRVIGLGLAGRREEARAGVLRMRQASRLPAFQSWIGCLIAWLDRSPDDLLATMATLGPLRIMEDPEAIFQMGWLLCELGEHEHALPPLRRAVDKGYFVVPTLSGSPHFDGLRGHPEFQALLADAEAGRERARVTFREAGGERLLGRR